MSKASNYSGRENEEAFLDFTYDLALFGTGLPCQETVPLKLVQTFQLSPQ